MYSKMSYHAPNGSRFTHVMFLIEMSEEEEKLLNTCCGSTIKRKCIDKMQ